MSPQLAPSRSHTPTASVSNNKNVGWGSPHRIPASSPTRITFSQWWAKAHSTEVAPFQIDQIILQSVQQVCLHNDKLLRRERCRRRNTCVLLECLRNTSALTRYVHLPAVVYVMSIRRTQDVYIREARRPLGVEASTNTFAEVEVELINPVSILAIIACRLPQRDKRRCGLICRFEEIATIPAGVVFVLALDKVSDPVSMCQSEISPKHSRRQRSLQARQQIRGRIGVAYAAGFRYAPARSVAHSH